MAAGNRISRCLGETVLLVFQIKESVCICVLGKGWDGAGGDFVLANLSLLVTFNLC